MCMSQKKTISVSLENYKKLKKYGLAGDPLNLAITRLIKLADLSAAGGMG